MSSPPSSERLVVQPQECLAGRAVCRYRAAPSSSLSQLPSSFRPGFAVVLLLAILTSMILYDVEGGVTTRASTITLNASEPPLDITSTAIDDANNRTYAASAIVSTISSSTLVIRRRDDTVEEATPTASARIRHVTSAADLPPSDVRSPDTLTPPLDDRLRPNDVTVTLPNSSDSSTRDVDYNATTTTTTITTVDSAFSAENWTAQNRNGDVSRQSTYNADAAGTSHSPSTPAVTPMTADTSTPSVVGRSTSGTVDSIAGSGFDGGGSRQVDATTTTAETAASRTDSSRPQKPDVIDALTDDEDDEDDSTALVDDAKVQFAPLGMTSSGTSSAAAASRTRNDTVQQPHQRAFEPFAPDVLFQQRSPPVVPLSRQRGRVAGGPASSTSRWRQPPHTTSRSVRLDNSTDCDLGVLAEAVQNQQQVLRQPSSRRWNDGGTSILPECVVYTFVLASLAPAHVSSSSSSSVNSFAESFNFSLSGFGRDDDVIIDAFLHLRVGVELPSPAARRSFIFVGVRLNGDDVTSVTVRKKFNRRRPLTPELCLRVGVADVIRSTLGQTGSGLLSVDIRLTGSSVGSVGGSRRRHHRLQQQQRQQHATDSRFVVRGTQGPFLSVKRHVCEDSKLPHRGP